jgi:predicted AlkP superfamily phosphohydrolase/phosphomutase
MEPYLSTTRTESATHSVTIGGWQFPLTSPRVTLLRHGQPFWDALEAQGVRTTIIRMPANYPPSGTATRELSGMGTPDILGTYGTFSFFSSSPLRLARSVSGGMVSAVDLVDNVVQAEIEGPVNPFRTPEQRLALPFTVYLDPREPIVKIAISGEERVLRVGEWSNWIPIEFPVMPLRRLRGMCRFYLKQVRPVFELYASPINLDPAAPAMPISTPPSYAADLTRTTGRFYTQGMPEETNGLIGQLLSRAEFLQQAALAGDEVTRQYWSVLAGFREGLLFYHFGNLDQVSHMLWRTRDPLHPAFDPSNDTRDRHVIEDLYVAFDRIAGETVNRVGAGTMVVVMSDHGFASWRRSFHLNSWLRDNGYLAIRDPTLREDPGAFLNVDWSRTRAYGLGLNGLYINLRGRERSGIVPTEGRAALVNEIRERLLSTIDPATGSPVVTKVDAREQIEASVTHENVAPDVIVGYAKGTRVSNESALGGLPAAIFEDNLSEWSGDHSMDSAVVPGLLLTSRPLRRRVTSLETMAPAILAEFGVEGFPATR